MEIYKRTNTVNGKVYIGQCSMKGIDPRWNDCLSQARKGKGSRLGGAIRKYGPKVFKKETLYIAKTKYELDRMETFFIILHQSNLSENGYNMTLGGEGSIGFKHDEKTKEKIGKISIVSHKLYPKSYLEAAVRISKTLTGRKNTWSHKTAETLRGRTSKNAGKTLIEICGEEKAREARDKIANWKRGRIWITNGLISKQIIKSDIIPDGWKLGFKKQQKRGWKVLSRTKGPRNWNKMWITDGTTSQMVNKNNPIPVGWRVGRIRKWKTIPFSKKKLAA
jgi:group I intron endonuclease